MRIWFFFKNIFFISKSSLSRSKKSKSDVSKIKPPFKKNSWTSKNLSANRSIFSLVFDHVIRVIVPKLVLNDWHKVFPMCDAIFFEIFQSTHFISKKFFEKKNQILKSYFEVRQYIIQYSERIRDEITKDKPL